MPRVWNVSHPRLARGRGLYRPRRLRLAAVEMGEPVCDRPRRLARGGHRTLRGMVVAIPKANGCCATSANCAARSSCAGARRLPVTTTCCCGSLTHEASSLAPAGSVIAIRLARLSPTRQTRLRPRRHDYICGSCCCVCCVRSLRRCLPRIGRGLYRARSSSRM
jgi:hypothetical protein